LTYLESDSGRDRLAERTAHFIKSYRYSARKRREEKYRYPGTTKYKLFEST
jgi:hypothetical protein